MSSSIFKCCNNSDTVSYSEATMSSMSRNLNINPTQKKSNYLHAPKSSLKTLTSIRSMKNLENANRSTLSYMSPPLQTIQEPVQKPVLVPMKNVLLIQPVQYTPQKCETYLAPYPRQMPAVQTASREKIRFSYSAEKGSENPEPISDPRVSKQLVFSVPRPSTAQVKYDIPVQQKEDSLNKSTAKRQILEKTSDNRKSQISEHDNISNRPKLGGSKFTILSQEEVHQVRQVEEKDMKMEQSAIIVNVFNPTKSQIEKWSVDARIVRKSHV